MWSWGPKEWFWCCDDDDDDDDGGGGGGDYEGDDDERDKNAFHNIFSECGGMLKGSSGLFLTPGYPLQFYSNNLNCLWTLSIPTDGFVIIEFLAFDTEQR